MKRFFALVLIVLLVFPGCATLCGNPAQLHSNLQGTVDNLKVLSSTLNADLQLGYDEEISMAYAAVTAILAAGENLLSRWCPDPNEVEKIISASNTVQVQATATLKRVRAKRSKVR